MKHVWVLARSLAVAGTLVLPQAHELLQTAAPADTKNSPAPAASQLQPIEKSQLCVTKGHIDVAGTRLSVTEPEVRAVLLHQTPQRIEAHFTYAGPTAGDKRLGSGELRRQFGLKLRAHNGCNLVYAMWRIEPQSQLVVSVKRNPGQSTHAQCGTRGYHNIKAASSTEVPALKPGDKHTLRAELHGRHLQIYVDNQNAWDGDIGADALAFDGPVGVRTDNGQFEFDLFTPKPVAGSKSHSTPCRASEEE